MLNMYGDKMTLFEVLGPADESGELGDTIAFTDDYSRVAAGIWLREQVRRGLLPCGSSLYRSVATDANAKAAGYTTSHYDI
ncbi:MAG: hypothetical protein FWH12_06355 [Treponema sp.]|nr:hypothetical protein [Treponema sp.]